MGRPINTIYEWRVLTPTESSWSSDDPDDPDFFVEFAARPGDLLRVQSRGPLALAQRIFRKPALVCVRVDDDGFRVRVVVGLTFVHRLFGRRFDHALTSLVEVRAAAGQQRSDLEVAAPATIELKMPPRWTRT